VLLFLLVFSFSPSLAQSLNLSCSYARTPSVSSFLICILSRSLPRDLSRACSLSHALSCALSNALLACLSLARSIPHALSLALFHALFFVYGCTHALLLALSQSYPHCNAVFRSLALFLSPFLLSALPRSLVFAFSSSFARSVGRQMWKALAKLQSAVLVVLGLSFSFQAQKAGVYHHGVLVPTKSSGQ